MVLIIRTYHHSHLCGVQCKDCLEQAGNRLSTGYSAIVVTTDDQFVLKYSRNWKGRHLQLVCMKTESPQKQWKLVTPLHCEMWGTNITFIAHNRWQYSNCQYHPEALPRTGPGAKVCQAWHPLGASITPFPYIGYGRPVVRSCFPWTGWCTSGSPSGVCLGGVCTEGCHLE